MNRKPLKGVVILSLSLTFAACAKAPEPQKTVSAPAAAAPAPSTVRAKSSPGARVFIAEPADGATVTSPVTIKFGVEGIELAKAGEVKDNSGHHHLLVDVDAMPPMDQPLPFNDHVFHFGQAQTEASINLTPGSHTLQLLFAGGNHIPHDPPVMSQKITITVK